MPIVKVRHEDILRSSHVKKLLELIGAAAQAEKPLLYTHKDAAGQEHSEEITVHYGMVKCMVSILYLFGKRISEVLDLRRKDFYVKYGYLYVRFRVLKKKTRIDLSMPVEKLKRIVLKGNEAFTMPVINYVKDLADPNMPLFPGRSRPHVQIVKTKDKQTGQIKKVYRYEFKREGTMSRQQAYRILKALDLEAYPHWFRHSLATELAEQGFTPHELKDWFDWSRYEQAVHYVEGMPSMTEAISKRKIE